MQARLNSFQKTMLQLNEMHSYNAVHVARIPGVFDEEQLRLNLNSTLEACGLTNLVLDRRRSSYAYLGGPANCDFKSIPGEPDSIPVLQAEIERQLNTPFQAAERINPFRFFAVTANADFFLGLAYFHPIADAESIVLLLRDLVRAYVKKVQSPSHLELYPDHRTHLLRRHAAVVVSKLLALPAQTRNLKQSRRPRF